MRRRPDLLIATDDQSRRRRLARRLAAAAAAAIGMTAGAGMRVAAAVCLWLRALLLLGHRVSSVPLYQQRGMLAGKLSPSDVGSHEIPALPFLLLP